jgi:sulfide:quinone oxidoreductase
MARARAAPSVSVMTTVPFRVLVAGGGIAGLEALLMLHAIAGDRVQLMLADAQPDFAYRPMKVAEPFARGRARRYPLADIARDVGAELVSDAITAVDDEARTARTAGGMALRYDALLLATGARAVPAYLHALTWDDSAGADRLGGLLRDVEQGYVRRLAFVVPAGPGWPLPAYELALMTARTASDAQTGAEIALVTPEAAPLAVFGARASEAVAAELTAVGVAFHGDAYAEVEKGRGTVVFIHPGPARLEFQRVVALPGLVGRAPRGVPVDDAGFIAVDRFGRVAGLERVWAAGDGIAFPVKFGGLAAAQADAAAETIAQLAGAPVVPEPFRPILRGRLLTGRGERFLHHAVGDGGGGEVADHALWWPPGKVAGARLAPYLSQRDEAAGLGVAPKPAGIDVQIDLTRELKAAPA